MKRRPKLKSGRGRVLGTFRANGGWLFAVQSFGVCRNGEPILVELLTVDQLKGQPRKRAEKWLEYLA